MSWGAKFSVTPARPVDLLDLARFAGSINLSEIENMVDTVGC